MKRFHIWALAALLLLLCACHAAEPAPEKIPDVQDVTAQGEERSEKTLHNGLARDEDGLVRYYHDGVAAELQPGVQVIDDKIYYVLSDGSICDAQRCTLRTPDGSICYFEDDCTLRPVQKGFNDLPDGTYYAASDGYTLCGFSNELAELDEALYAFDESGRVLHFDQGVQQIFGGLYLLDEPGSAICLHEPGTLLREDGLYYVTQDGSLASDASQGYLHFGADGRYTSGDETLDAAVEALLEACGGIDPQNPEQTLRAAYTWIRENYKYLSMEHQQPGTTDWELPCALTFFDLGKGNCYCWAAAVSYCARRLGYQAYVVAGWESNPDNDHAWTMIDWSDGESYLFDAQLEYAYWYMFENKPKIDMFRCSGDGTSYNGFTYYFP